MNSEVGMQVKSKVVIVKGTISLEMWETYITSRIPLVYIQNRCVAPLRAINLP